MTDALVVMPSNNTGATVRSLADRFPGRLAHLIAPGGWRVPILPYALDNGAFTSYLRQQPFDDEAFLTLCDRARAFETLAASSGLVPGRVSPLWLVVPDVVADAKATLESWARWAPTLRDYGWPLAFVVQDGMFPNAVPSDVDVVFVGGSKPWKWRTVSMWSSWFPRVHVGRVNQPARLEFLEDLGVESCDGTGWLRGDQMQLSGLVGFLSGHRNLRLFETLEELPPIAEGVKA